VRQSILSDRPLVGGAITFEDPRSELQRYIFIQEMDRYSEGRLHRLSGQASAGHFKITGDRHQAELILPETLQ